MDVRPLAAGCWLATIAVVAFAAPAVAAARVWTVMSPDDGGTCEADACHSLRAALAAAGDGDAISLPAYGRDYTFKGELPAVTRSLTVVGDGADRTVIRAVDGRVFEIGDPQGATTPVVTLAHLQVAGGRSAYWYGGNLLNHARLTLDHVRVTQGQAGAGGGVASLDGAELRITRSLIDHNRAQSGDARETGGGIYSRGVLAIADSTIAFNDARAGGGIAVDGSTATLEHVTVARSAARAGAAGGLLIAGDASAAVAGSLLAGNTSGETLAAAANCARPLPADGGGNLAFPDDCGFGPAADPQLAGDLVPGLGETPVLPIPAGSSAVDRAGACSGRDQRDLERPQDVACDAGAYEVAAPAIDAGPSGTVLDGSASFAFSSAEPEPSFECRLDGPAGPGDWEPCRSPKTYAGLTAGSYTFLVRALGGNAPAARAFGVAVAPAPQPAPPSRPAPAQPPPVPAPTATPQPRYGKSVVVRPTRGTVKVRRPGTQRYVVLEAVGELPLGTSIDVRKGRVRLFTARDRTGRRQSAQFHAGVFRVVQRGGVIELQLRGPVPTCGSRTGHASAAAAKRKKRTRRLWGSGRGRFRTRGHYSAATVRGTTWLVEDRCHSTLTRVKVGVVRVRDFGRRRSVLIRAGNRYVARKPANASR
jgi:hypothetical protein